MSAERSPKFERENRNSGIHPVDGSRDRVDQALGGNSADNGGLTEATEAFQSVSGILEKGRHASVSERRRILMRRLGNRFNR